MDLSTQRDHPLWSRATLSLSEMPEKLNGGGNEETGMNLSGGIKTDSQQMPDFRLAMRAGKIDAINEGRGLIDGR
jgi:hypothetical protein